MNIWIYVFISIRYPHGTYLALGVDLCVQLEIMSSLAPTTAKGLGDSDKRFCEGRVHVWVLDDKDVKGCVGC